MLKFFGSGAREGMSVLILEEVRCLRERGGATLGLASCVYMGVDMGVVVS
jgi:hypothetical protein